MLADGLDCFLADLEALLGHFEMTALVLDTATGETFETHHNRLGAGHILATVAHHLDIYCLPWWLVANCCMSCSMENGDKTEKRLEMAAVKAGNHTHVAVDMDWRVSQIDCLCRWQVIYHELVIPKCCHGAVASQICHLVAEYSLSLVAIFSSTCLVNKDGGKLLSMQDVMENESEYG